MNFQWLNESNLTKEGEKITIYAPAGTDFFCNDGTVSEEGVTPESLHNAPFYYTELSGDFVLTVKVCVLSIENPQNRKENSPLSDREIPIIRKKHVESFRFFPYLVGKKAAFTAFCPIG